MDVCGCKDRIQNWKGYEMSEVAEKKFDKAVVEAQLATGLSRVQFYKVDGTIREIVCTRDMTIIPFDKRPTTDGKALRSDTTVSVYDVEANSWKSFILENLIFIDKE